MLERPAKLFAITEISMLLYSRYCFGLLSGNHETIIIALTVKLW